jgi:hypothetical protein
MSKQSQFARLVSKAYDIPPKAIPPNKRSTKTVQGWERAQFGDLFQRHFPERYLGTKKLAPKRALHRVRRSSK